MKVVQGLHPGIDLIPDGVGLKKWLSLQNRHFPGLIISNVRSEAAQETVQKPVTFFSGNLFFKIQIAVVLKAVLQCLL